MRAQGCIEVDAARRQHRRLACFARVEEQAGAISFDCIGAVEALLDCGAAVDGVDGDGTPLAYAMHFGYPEIAQLLAQRGATLDLRFASSAS